MAELSVYVDPLETGRGFGGQLLDALVTSSERARIWTLQAQIFPQNTASLHLHRRRGFRTVGIRERIGELNGEWRDVVLLERRSLSIGLPTQSQGESQVTGEGSDPWKNA